MANEVIELLIEGGKATGGPPLGPKIGPMGLNINEVVNAINERTSEFEGMKIPVKVIVDTETKKFDIEVGTPPTSALIKKELNIEKGSSNGNPVGNLTLEQLLKIVKMKRGQLLANSLKAAVKEVIGTCISMGVTVDGKHGKEILKEIEEGRYDDKLSQ
ncbi:MAG: 50S ribosomal protein L11 [Candidatus Altiarchaeales archaeon]|nr:MAG: 50S ribosomal protein L11 [Candidatus Altiarchaeales archaeon]RLI94880.1 MAG: 50S ribosomal protein L11 [Candidatus Altiarchaeales archaeon]RLI94978.1 MAG: 50S ribosomal protein L11 [Candidatus Altiarchaeales archaeon]HDO82734.1 50S ribosomal protein L11 [Candidatus Altiarchaeales archaeon]HEX55383.1 50S ribosomal protein L11 [Candidatus Altiarchaeales archaeon]